ncbi:BrnT family toxin [bacterium]|nr:MAG: BrnT family toxin [bacterium]
MEITTVIWLHEIVEKISRKHKVKPSEVIEVLNSSTHFRFVEKGYRSGENVYSAMGQVRAGRYLIVFFVYKRGKQALILSARDMTRSERKRYEKK